MQIRLHAHADISIGLARAGVEFERGIDVCALLHVDPESLLSGGRCGAGTLDQLREIRETEFAVEIEAQLRQLDGNFRWQVRVADAIEQIEIMRGDALRFGALGNIFAELRQQRGDAAFGAAARAAASASSAFSPGMNRAAAARTKPKRGARSRSQRLSDAFTSMRRIKFIERSSQA